MIVVDTNTIAYLYLPTDFTGYCEQLLKIDREWAAPHLWKSELRNILALYLRKSILDFDAACHIQSQAELLLSGNEYIVDSIGVLALCTESSCSAYDCEFVALARSLNTRLITHDKNLLKAFPQIGMTAKDFIALTL
jgi:predicted nucleic acid-binding protein